VLTSGGVPIASQPVTFTILDMPGAEAKGAMLVASSAVTDGSGAATVEVQAGDATQFQLRAAAAGVQKDVVVIVAISFGSVVVSPFFTPESKTAGMTLSIEVRLFDDASCAYINLVDPSSPIRGFQPLPPSGGMIRYDLVSATKNSAVAGRALGGHGAVAIGCIDLIGSSLLPDGVVEVALPLRDTVPNPVGRFTATSPIVFLPPLAAAASIADEWRKLSGCPLDPGQRFLDCMIDALSTSATDQLDCKPSPLAGAEGPLGDALTALRGVPIMGMDGATTACRSAADAGGRPSLDAVVMGLFGSPTPHLVVALPAIADAAARLFDRVELTSTLDVQSAGRADQYVVTHTLREAGFGIEGAMANVDLVTLALPALTAYTTATTRDGVLILDDHGFSLRLGRVGRVGFGRAVLAPRLGVQDLGGPAPNGGDLIAALAVLARSEDGTVSGCAAIDRALCAAVGGPPGCLATACPTGLSTLAASLDAAFDVADGTGLDLVLAGAAPLLNLRRDGSAHQLGAPLDDPSNPTGPFATWMVDLRTGKDRARLMTNWYGVRD